MATALVRPFENSCGGQAARPPLDPDLDHPRRLDVHTLLLIEQPFAEDDTESFVLRAGRLRVQTGQGSGVTVREELVAAWAQRPVEVLREI